ncbi:hypothetical protein KM043_001957 [Ampulex compressa]|nr:hypothetical protein KM043_001957 [Ampulex compressa]
MYRGNLLGRAEGRERRAESEVSEGLGEESARKEGNSSPEVHAPFPIADSLGKSAVVEVEAAAPTAAPRPNEPVAALRPFRKNGCTFYSRVPSWRLREDRRGVGEGAKAFERGERKRKKRSCLARTGQIRVPADSQGLERDTRPNLSSPCPSIHRPSHRAGVPAIGNNLKSFDETTPEAEPVLRARFNPSLASAPDGRTLLVAPAPPQRDPQTSSFQRPPRHALQDANPRCRQNAPTSREAAIARIFRWTLPSFPLEARSPLDGR